AAPLSLHQSATATHNTLPIPLLRAASSTTTLSNSATLSPYEPITLPTANPSSRPLASATKKHRLTLLSRSSASSIAAYSPSPHPTPPPTPHIPTATSPSQTPTTPPTAPTATPSPLINASRKHRPPTYSP